MKKSPIAALGALVIATALALGGCSTSTSSSYKVAITQIVSHPSLDASREGFKQALKDAGLEVSYDEQNAQGDQGTATSIAAKFASDKPDLVLAIATPTAQATAQAITDIPILFTAVTDPVAAKLVETNDVPGGNVTGTTDMNPVAEQIALIKQLKPDARSVGIVYSSGEVNSEVQVVLARTAAEQQGLSVVEKTVTNSSEVQQAANALDTDAIYVPTDNIVVSGLDAVLQVAEAKKIPVVVGEADSVKKGGLITYGIDYNKLGYQTGQMAVKVLKDGAKPANMPVERQAEYRLVINTQAAERMGITVPQTLLDKADEKI